MTDKEIRAEVQTLCYAANDMGQQSIRDGFARAGELIDRLTAENKRQAEEIRGLTERLEAWRTSAHIHGAHRHLRQRRDSDTN